MQYKLFHYVLTGPNDKEINPDRHFQLFNAAKGPDVYGEFAAYRGKRDSVLMHVREYRPDFIGLIGRHSTEREITAYDSSEDVTHRVAVDDDDYPNAQFICFPRLRMIVCTDVGGIRANAAMSRLHQILTHRHRALFVFEEVSETFDLRKAVKRFRVVEVNFEIFPVNPHTKDLGTNLDNAKKLDHIKKLNGSAVGAISEPLGLEGGFLTAVQQLQESGHAKVGFKGYTEDKQIEVNVPKPTQRRALSENEEEQSHGENVGVRINIPGKEEYPFDERFVHKMRQVALKFRNTDGE